MKTKYFFIVIFALVSLTFALPSHSWQGRMAGMGNPYGLVQDESDFLLHPAGIAKGKGINFYGSYRFNYSDVTNWNYTKDFFDLGGTLIAHFPFRGSGDEKEHHALMGGAFPLGPGRMGMFFQYSDKRGDHEGKETANDFGPATFNRYSLGSELDSFALRLLYGLPTDGFKLGGEIQLAYRQEENRTSFNGLVGGSAISIENSVIGPDEDVQDLFPFMLPYDSKYWEPLLKGSIEGVIGSAKVALTLRGGFIFAGDNNLDFKFFNSDASPGGSKIDGDVKGWSIGSDLWVRYPLVEGASLPFLLKIGYQKKSRNGDGAGLGINSDVILNYKNREKIFQVEVGGGVDKEVAKGTRIAGGIYYGFLRNKNDFLLNLSGELIDIQDQPDFPKHTEHRIILRLVGEKELSPMIAMRMGLNFFYGWVKEEYNYNKVLWEFSDLLSLNGSHGGLGAFLGGTMKFQKFSLEPFLGGGYQNLDLSGNGIFTGIGPLEMDKLRKEWSIGGGFSVKF
jgi:hypothetical protein